MIVRGLLRKLIEIDADDTPSIEKLEFLEDFLDTMYDTYTSHCSYKGLEDDFSEELVKPYVDVVTRHLKPNDCKAGFVKGQPILESMTSQLRLQGNSFA